VAPAPVGDLWFDMATDNDAIRLRRRRRAVQIQTCDLASGAAMWAALIQLGAPGHGALLRERRHGLPHGL